MTNGKNCSASATWAAARLRRRQGRRRRRQEQREEGELFSLGDEDPAWLNLQQAAPGFVFESRCISVCMAANDLNFDFNFHGGFRTPVRVDGVVQYRLRDSPIVRFVSAPRDRSGCHSLIPVDHDTFRLPPLARITLEQVDEPGEWDANGHVIWQRCYTVSLSYG